MEKQNHVKQYVVIILSMIFFSLSFIWFKVANVTYGPLTIVLFRLAISAIAVFGFNRITKNLTVPNKKDLKYLLLLAFFEPFLYFLGESYGLQYISATIAAAIIATIPLIAPFAAYIFFREKVSVKNVIGILISFLGVAIVIFNVGDGISASPIGILLQFGAVLAAVGYATVIQKISTRVNNLSIIFYQNLFGAIYFLPIWLIVEKNSFFASTFSWESMLAIIKLAILVSSVAYIFFAYSIRNLGIIKANMFTNTIPVFTAIFAWMILGDEFNAQKITGIIVVITGLFVAQWKSKKQYDGPDPIPFE
jgi:drug/metabolite transporter (DMT)-like permease